MSWSSPLRALGVCGVWLAIQTGCGGNPEVTNGGQGTDGGTDSGGSAGTSTGGSLVIGVGGEGDAPNQGGSGGTTPTYECGNGEIEPEEFCDDGNAEDDDGCSADCKTVNPDYDCSEVGKPCVQVVICGNGVLEGEEACDDANTENDDGCSFDCGEQEEGWICVRPGKPCVEKPECGNGLRERGEECDDNDKQSGDGCSDVCKIEPDYYCPKPGEDCVSQVCGDGTRVKGEECDDGNKALNDGCSAACKVEAGWHCNVNGCKPECGDGLMKGTEACDDGDAIGGDGCSSACKIEPYFKCAGLPSACTPKTAAELCGNGDLDPIFSFDNTAMAWKATGREVCDPPSALTGCNAGCASVTAVTTPSVCGNGKIEGTETCESSDTAACKNCQVQPGYTCTQPTVCRPNPRCGDGTLNPGEACDDGDAMGGDGCSATCTVETDYTCVGLEPSVCVKPVCGNSAIEPGELCDDGNAVAADGCSACKITNGWACPSPGAPCIPKCGDGVRVAGEACDDGNKVSGDGCNTGCKIEPGFKCPTPNVKCVASVCGDTTKDEGEGCDDGNKIAGDGCGPTCQPEPTVTVGPNPSVNVFCGDGLKTGAEECDDGNTVSGDGCESDCKETDGWTCSAKLTLPTSLDMRVTYRDFKSANALTAGGHPDFQYNTFSQVRGITGNACTSATAASCGRLDVNGKPPLIRTGQQNNATGTSTGTGIMSADTFGLWYRSTNPNNVAGYNGAIQISPFTKTLTLAQQGGVTSEVYAFSSGNFYPLGQNEGFGRIGAEVNRCDTDAGANTGVRNQANACGGCDSTCQNRNFGFTSELRYFFQYKGGERLTFTGDDDVWVYVNGKLAVDLGGLHSELSGQVVLGDDGNGTASADSDCSAHGVAFAALPDPAGCFSAAEANNATDSRFGLTKGGVYEIVLFHAERHSNASNFRLTLAGFLAPRSFCTTECGDGVIAGTEFCDDGAANSDTVSGACKTDCTIRNYCGDGTRQLPGEACDNGVNTDLYKTAVSAPSVCAPGCKVPPSCGDGTLQASFEQCDKGGANNNNAYGPDECRADCKLGGYCGDGTAQAGRETCDLGANNGKTYGPTSCGYDCKPGRRCGDGILNDASEKCDDGAMNGSIGSHCSVTCAIVPYCGDGATKAPEECDYGTNFNQEMPDYGGCSNLCTWGPKCGDDVTDPEEECDDGAANNNSTYDGCTLACTLGPRCGDGVKQATETCDNGFNEDDYEDVMSTTEQCGVGCKRPPFCGDGKKQEAYEYCDDGTTTNAKNLYNGCNSKCEYGPYCGDKLVQTDDGETCDEGAGNVAYTPTKGGCSYDCQPAPYCGDGVRNGPEQCDLGAKENTGEYGKCKKDCTFGPRCGDNVQDKGEECDEGPTGGPNCLSSCKRRPVVQ
ncbi:MAG: Multiple EGF-like-domain protein 3 precursor [Polyangiaceae bacterium]|jgi:fibro-slime domain-containing protein|nr:Multiple EGF-like-domain protein 3 precursor [Polyangiaceae bacterium]